MHVLVLRCGQIAVQQSEDENRGVVRGSNRLSDDRAGHLETMVQQSGERLITVGVGERRTPRALIQDDAQVLPFGTAHAKSLLTTSFAESSRMFRTSTPSGGSGVPAAWNSHFTARG